MPPSHRLTVDDAARLLPLGQDGPTDLRFGPDGRSLLYLKARSDSTVHDLWRHPLDGGATMILTGEAGPPRYDPAEELRRERRRLTRDGVTEYDLQADTVVARMGGRLMRGTSQGGFAPWPGAEAADAHRIVPDGQALILARDGDLWRVDAGGATRRLTHGGSEGVTFGLADYAADEEFDRHTGMWLSPDGRHLALTRVDARPVPEFAIVHGAQNPPRIETLRYPFAGGPNADVRLGVLALDEEGTPIRWLDRFDDAYLARVVWTAAGDLLCLVFDRDQHTCEWRRFVQGTGTARPFGREQRGHWLPLPAGVVPLADGGLLTTREHGGHIHLVRYDATGGATTVTAGDFDITAIYGLDREGRALVQRSDRAGLERKVARIASDGTVTDLTVGRGVHDAVWAWDFDRFVRLSQSLVAPTAADLCDRDGRPIVSVHRPRADAAMLGLRPPELVDVAAEDGTLLHGAVYRPHDAPPGHQPAVVSVYGGPHAQRVRDDWSLTADLRCQLLAQEGVLAFKLDNRGSDGRGPAFARAVEHGFATVEVRDQVAGVRHLIGHEGVDARRVGIFGWSYGGFMTLQALLQVPDVFCVGVAGAPVTDFSRYDTAYTERHLGTPAAHPEAYRHADVLARVQALKGALLIIHGLVDENVHFAHTARLVQALIEAQKPFDLAVLPTSRHLPRDGPTRRYVERRTIAWLLDHLR